MSEEKVAEAVTEDENQTKEYYIEKNKNLIKRIEGLQKDINEVENQSYKLKETNQELLKDLADLQSQVKSANKKEQDALNKIKELQKNLTLAQEARKHAETDVITLMKQNKVLEQQIPQPHNRVVTANIRN